jgi:hypothetical protein
MADREQEYDKYLRKIADNIDISDTMRDKAIDSYNAVGRWLGDCSEDSDVKIYPQGSFYLGTVIKPVTDKDDYDIDLVCLLKDMQSASDYEIKNIIGNRLKEHDKYAVMLDNKEGKRCWTLHYDEFHMDILPCSPKETVYLEPYLTNIRFTHRIAPRKYIPMYSNPYKYHEWFEHRMQVRLLEARKEFSARKQVEISKVPLHVVKTPLQRAIQLLKRHKILMYQDAPQAQKDNAPISIIITTLAAHAYNDENNVFEALKNILNNMQKYIEVRDGEYWIGNPAMPEENFAEKWNADPSIQAEFIRWLDQAKQDMLVEPLKEYGLHKVSESMKHSFGSNIVKKSFLDLGYQTKADREKGNLFVTSLKGGLTTSVEDGAKKVGDHTYFGE